MEVDRMVVAASRLSGGVTGWRTVWMGAMSRTVSMSKSMLYVGIQVILFE